MKIKTLTAVAALLAGTVIAGPASAFQGYVTNSVNLRAGPGTNYPVVARVSASRPLAINGCLQGFDWCEVQAGRYHGWVSGDYLEGEYNDDREYISDLGPEVNLPVINFEFGSYWDQNYRNRSFYKQRAHYAPLEYHQGPSHRDDRNDRHDDNDNRAYYNQDHQDNRHDNHPDNRQDNNTQNNNDGYPQGYDRGRR